MSITNAHTVAKGNTDLLMTVMNIEVTVKVKAQFVAPQHLNSTFWNFLERDNCSPLIVILFDSSSSFVTKIIKGDSPPFPPPC